MNAHLPDSSAVASPSGASRHHGHRLGHGLHIPHGHRLVHSHNLRLVFLALLCLVLALIVWALAPPAASAGSALILGATGGASLDA